MRDLPKCYLLHTDPLEFRKLGKTCQATCFPLSTLNHWSFTEHTSWPSKPRLPKFPQWDSWAWIMSQKMRWCAMSLNHGLWRLFVWIWARALKEIFLKSMIMLTWCGSPMKWSHVVWKICPQQTYHRKIGCKYKIVEKKIFLRRHFPILIIETLKVISTRYNNTNDNSV